MKELSEYNKQFIIDHFEEFVNKKNSSVAFQNMTGDFLDHDEAGGVAIGPQAAVDMMEGVYANIPDIRVSIEDILAEGDKVVVRNIWTGTTAGGKKIQFKGFVLWRIENGKIAERWATLTPPYEWSGEKGEW